MEDAKRYINMDGGIARVRGNKKLYRRMLGMFMASTEFAAFEESIAANDIEKAADAAHGIKGITGNLELPLLFETSSELMNQLRKGELNMPLVESYREILVKTKECVEQTMQAIDNGA